MENEFKKEIKLVKEPNKKNSEINPIKEFGTNFIKEKNAGEMIDEIVEEPLEEILKICEIKPTVIQVEAHPYYPQNELKERTKKDDIHIQAWYPLGHGDRGLIEEPVFTKLAEKYGKSNAQIILRWHIQEGNIIIPGSKNPEHIKDNANIFDFELKDDEMNEIAKINKNQRYYIPNPELTASYATMELNPELDV